MDHDDSSGACWKTAWGLLPVMVRPYSGPTLWSVLTSWEAHHHHWCFVLLACLTYVDFNCLKFQKHLYKPCNSIEDPFEWYWSQPSYRALPRWHMESILHYKGLWWFLISCVWRGGERHSWGQWNWFKHRYIKLYWAGMLWHSLCVGMLILTSLY